MTKKIGLLILAVLCLLLLFFLRVAALAFVSILLWAVVLAAIPWFLYRVFLRPRLRARRIAQIGLDRAFRAIRGEKESTED